MQTASSNFFSIASTVLGPKLLLLVLVMGDFGEKNCIQLPSVGEQHAN